MNTNKNSLFLVYIILLMTAACRMGGKTEATAVKDTTSKKDSVSRKWKYHTVQKLDTGTAVLLDTVIGGKAIVISRKGDTAEDNLDFSVSGKKVRIPQGGHRGAELYSGIINITNPTLASDSISWKNDLLMATFDRIFSQGELYAIRRTKDKLKVLTFRSDESIISYNGAFFVDPVRKQVVCFSPVNPDEKLISMEVFSIGKNSFRYIGSFKVATKQYYDLENPVVIKSYLKWAKGR